MRQRIDGLENEPDYRIFKSKRPAPKLVYVPTIDLERDIKLLLTGLSIGIIVCAISAYLWS